MKRVGFPLLVSLLVLTVAARAWASPGTIEDLLRDDGIIVDQQPTQVGGPLADTLALDEFGYQMWQQLADNIRLTQAATVRRLYWDGFYGGDLQSHQPPPGDILLEESFLNPSRAFTGQIVGVGGLPKEYLFQADLTAPISLSADTIYWLEVVQVGDVNSTFRWESGYGLVGYSAYINDYTPAWTSVPGSYAFQLSTLPEPATIALLACAVLFGRPRLRGRKGNRQRGLTGHPNEEHQP